MPLSRRGLLRACLPSLAPGVPANSATLVAVFLRGGADGLNMVVPYGDPDYARLRPSLAISAPGRSEESCLDLDGFFGLHPALAPLAPAYAERRLAIVHAVGSDDATRSHFEAQDQMEHGAAFGQRVPGGWVARYLRSRGETNALAAVAIGTQVPESLRGAPMTAAMTSLESLKLRGVKGAAQGKAMNALGRLYSGQGLLAAAGRDSLQLLERVERLSAEPAEGEGRRAPADPGAAKAQRQPSAQRRYPQGDFGQGLRDVAQLVKAQVGLRVACLDLGGWDTHFFQGSSSGLQAGRMAELAAGLAAFQEDLGSWREQVLLVVMTEFGRRAYENTSLGTDHGRASMMLLLGAGIKGGEVFGQWPGLSPEALEGPGDLAVTTDYRSVLSEVLARTSATSLDEEVFPGFTPEPLGLFA